MDLKDYIEKSLYSIISAVGTVQENVRDLGVIVYPSTIKDGYVDNHGKRKLMNIKFDVAVTVDETKNNEKGVSIKVVELLSGGIKTSDKSQNQSISRISFEIPVAMPIIDNLTEEARKENQANINRIASMT